jgi:hypothetical protein
LSFSSSWPTSVFASFNSAFISTRRLSIVLPVIRTDKFRRRTKWYRNFPDSSVSCVWSNRFWKCIDALVTCVQLVTNAIFTVITKAVKMWVHSVYHHRTSLARSVRVGSVFHAGQTYC